MSRRRSFPAAALLLGALLVASSPVMAFERWTATKRLELTGADGLRFDQPTDLVVHEGTVAVLDGLNNRLCRFDGGGHFLGSIRGTAEAPFTSSLGLSRDYRGRYLLTDAARGRVVAAEPGGRVTVLATLPREEKGRPPDPAGILFMADRIFLSDNDNHRVLVLGPEGAVQASWGGLGDAAGRFKYPGRLAGDSGGRIAVADVLNARVQLFNPGGQHLASIGSPGVVSGTLFRPGGISFDERGGLWIADAYFGTVQVFDTQGGHRALLYGPGGEVLTLSSPVALKVVGRALWVVEAGDNRVTLYDVTR